MKRPSTLLRAGVLLLTGALVSGCGYTGIDSVSLPFRQGTGSGAYLVTVEMAQAEGLTPNAEVKVGDVTVGTIQDATTKGWTAELTVGLDPDVQLPANATATIGQKSLLGAKYLDLSAPADEAPVGHLQDGDVIPLPRTGHYPATEEVLAALGVVLNGSGLQQVKTITQELDRVLGGREQDVRGFVNRLDDFLGALDDQRDDIVRLVENLNRFSQGLDVQNHQLADALDELPAALDVLNQDKDALVGALDSVGRLGEVGTRVIDRSREDLLANLAHLRPALARLADAGQDLPQSLSQVVSFPFPSNTSFPAMFRGDYANLFLSLDLSPDTIRRNFTEGFQLQAPGAPSLLSAPPLGRGDEGTDPLGPFTGPLTGPLTPPLSTPSLPTLPAPPEAGATGENNPGLLGGLLGGDR